MIDFFTKINNFLAANMFILVLSGLFAGFTVHMSGTAFLRVVIISLFAYMTFVTALNTSFKDFVKTLKKPGLALWILFFVHVVGPFFAYIVGMIFYPDNADIRLGYLIGASIPIGVTSLIWVGIIGGNLPASILAVTLDTILTPVILPVLFRFVVDQSIELDYSKMLVELMLMVTVPSILGMLINDWSKGCAVKFAGSFGGVLAKLSMFVIIFINSAMIMPYISWDKYIVKPVLVTLLIVAGGYFIGYLGSFIFKERSFETKLTMILNVGIRNNACGVAIALAYFQPAVAVPITLAMLFQQPLATIISKIFKRETMIGVCAGKN